MTASTNDKLRTAAAEIVAQLADRLRDPEQVHRATNLANGERIDVDNIRVPPWDVTSLSRGPAALVMLHAELGHTDETFREVAHRCLASTSAATAGRPVGGPFDGLGSLATATRVAAEGHGDYQAVLARLDTRMAEFARWLAAVQHATRRDGVPTTAGVVDVISGMAGVGRYLLHRSETCSDALREVLAALVTLGESIVVDGVELPGWWHDGTEKTIIDESFEQGQFNFGLAHGVPGPLALLSLAWSAGFRVPGQAETIAAMADWMLDWRETDEFGYFWTGYVPLSYVVERGGGATPRAPARPSWCYGAAGIARALEFASAALDRPEWAAAGLDAVRSTLAQDPETWAITDDMLCHGWASSLYLCCLFGWNHPDGEFQVAADRLAERLIERFEPGAVFGYRFYQPSEELYLDLPGFLEGSAGIALALHAYATDRPPASQWDTVLMLR